MFKLVVRMFQKTILVQAALVLVIATAVTVLMIYNAYISREGVEFSAKVQSRIPQGLLLAKTIPTTEVTAISVRGYAQFLAAWREGLVTSKVGDLPCAFFTTDSRIRSLAPPGTAYISLRLAHKFGLTSGDSLILKEGKREVTAVVEIYEGFAFGLGYDFGDRVLVFTGVPEESTSFLYAHIRGALSDAKNDIKLIHRDCSIADVETEQAIGSQYIENNYAGVTQAQISLVMFVSLAFLTAKILSFLDGRRTLAILKSIGLRNGEVAAVLAAEALLAPILGASFGVFAGWRILAMLAQRGSGLMFTPAVAWSAVLYTLPATIIGVAVPSRLAQVATVIELLFQRSIPLFHEQVQTLSRRFPEIEAFTERGTRFVKLVTVDGEFEGITLRKLGDEVKQGEVLAHGTSWWGLKVTQYVAPVDGTIVYFEPQTGFVGIGPKELLGWVPETRGPISRCNDRVELV